MKYLVAIIAMILVSCSVSQYTMYRPYDETRGWNIECKKSVGNGFDLLIDGNKVLTGGFTFFKQNFESAVLYKGHKLQMFGFRRSIPGPSESWTDEVHIRLIIDESEVTNFVF